MKHLEAENVKQEEIQPAWAELGATNGDARNIDRSEFLLLAHYDVS